MGRRVDIIIIILLFLRLLPAWAWEQKARTAAALLAREPEHLMEAAVLEARTFADGRRLYHLGLDGGLRAALVLPDSESAVFQVGDHLRGRFSFSLPEAARNPGGFDERLSFLRSRIQLRARLADAKLLPELLAKKSDWLYPVRWIAALRDDVSQRLCAALGEEAGGLCSALLLGDKTSLDVTSEDEFKRAGLAHLLVVSSGNVALWLYFFEALSTRCLRRFKPRQFLLIAAALLFAALSEWNAAVSRAALMFGFKALAEALKRPLSRVRALFYSAFLMLLWNERRLFQPGFWMSLCVTLAILLWAQPLRHVLLRGQALLLLRFFSPKQAERCLNFSQGAAALLALTLVAQLAVLPFYAAFRSVWGPLQILVNLPAMLLMPFILLLSFLLLAFLYLPLGSGLLSPLPVLPLTAALRSLAALAQIGAAAPGHFIMNWERLLPFLPFYFLFGVKLVLERRRRRLHPYAWAWAGLSALLLFFAAYQFRPAFRVSFLDVGQGACVLVQDKSGRSLLFDCGPASSWSALRNTLDYYAISSCDLLVLSHLHEDHCGNFQQILKKRTPGAVLLPPDPPGTAPEQLWLSAKQRQDEQACVRLKSEFVELCRQYGVPVYEARRGCCLRVGDISARVLHSAYEGGSLGNVGSFVLAVEMEGGTLGLTGDANGGIWTELRRRGELDDVVVFQCPHHGAKDALPEQTSEIGWPGKAVVAQVGRRNLYGHPHAAVLKSLQEANVMLFRSDRDACVEIMLRSGRWTLRSFWGEGQSYLLHD